MGAFVRNERTKLTATYLNGLAIAILAVGALAPVINVASGQAKPTISTALTPAICALISVALHLVARRLLKALED
jgi:hypothetical protein